MLNFYSIIYDFAVTFEYFKFRNSLGEAANFIKHTGNFKRSDWLSKLIGIFQLMRIVSGASNGLSHLHSNGIIHSNIKASNVMIDGDFTPKASFHCKILASDWSTNEN